MRTHKAQGSGFRVLERSEVIVRYLYLQRRDRMWASSSDGELDVVRFADMKTCHTVLFDMCFLCFSVMELFVVTK